MHFLYVGYTIREKSHASYHIPGRAPKFNGAQTQFDQNANDK